MKWSETIPIVTYIELHLLSYPGMAEGGKYSSAVVQ